MPLGRILRMFSLNKQKECYLSMYFCKETNNFILFDTGADVSVQVTQQDT